MEKNNQITTDVVKINWEQMIKDTLNRRNWGKVYTLLNYNDTKITLEADEIEIINSSIFFRVGITHVGEHGQHINIHNYMSVPFEKDNFNEIVFTKKLYRRGCDVMNMVAGRILQRTKEYDNQLQMDRNYSKYYHNEVDERVSDIMSDMPEMEKSITDLIEEALRNHLLDNFIETEYASDYLEEHAPTITSLMQLSWAIITNQEKDVIDKCLETSHEYHDLEVIESTVEEMEALLEELEEKAYEEVEAIEVNMEDLI